MEKSSEIYYKRSSLVFFCLVKHVIPNWFAIQNSLRIMIASAFADKNYLLESRGEIMKKYRWGKAPLI